MGGSSADASSPSHSQLSPAAGPGHGHSSSHDGRGGGRTGGNNTGSAASNNILGLFGSRSGSGDGRISL